MGTSEDRAPVQGLAKKTRISDLRRLMYARRGPEPAPCTPGPARKEAVSSGKLAALASAGLACVFAFASPAAFAAPLPPPEVARLLEAPPPPNISEDPQKRYLLLVQQLDLLPAASLAEPMLSVVGLK